MQLAYSLADDIHVLTRILEQFNSYSMINFIRKCSYININDQFHDINAVSASAHQSMSNLID